MAPPNNFRIARLTWQMQRDTRTFDNTLHLYRAAGWTLADLISACNQAKTWWTTFAQPQLPNTVGLYNIHGQVYDPTGNPYVYDLAVSPVTYGALTNDSEPANVTLSCSLRAGLAGRAYRGRIYWPGFVVTDTNIDDTVASARLAGISNAIVGLLVAFASGTTPVIFHRNDNLFSTIIGTVMENVLDSQRRRLPKRGT
jgi:hypothetical protein